MLKFYAIVIALLLCRFAVAQKADSTSTLQEVVVTAFEQNRVVNSGTIVKILQPGAADMQNKISLVTAFNSIAGVRLEERSPGSYRLNLRGSTLRSPFGVRNVKVYWNDIPVTDPGGNTYFNQFAFNNFSSIEIIKGPAGSMYGAGTGGAVLIHSFSNNTVPAVKFEYIGGSYGLQNVLSSVNYGTAKNQGVISFAHNESDGYRNHTQSKKDNFSYCTQNNITGKQQINTSILYTNLYYQTPGALTLNEYRLAPHQARPAAGGFPDADAAHAAIYQKTFTAGVSQVYHFSDAIKNTTILYGSFAQFKNPTFRNYECRIEPSFGGRTTFSYTRKNNTMVTRLVAGAEFQQGYFNIQTAKNKNGTPDTLQTNDDVHFGNASFFAQADISIHDDWIITAGASINTTKVGFTRLSTYPVADQKRTYKNEISPRIAIEKKLSGTTVFGSISKGFSPPTTAELLPNTGVISTFLEAEEGINYEAGLRSSFLHNRLHTELTGFYFRLNHALVTRKDSSNADYYVNAGNINQKGAEANADYALLPHSHFLKSIYFQSSYTYFHFKYGDYSKGTASYMGKTVPGIPTGTFSFIVNIQSRSGFYLNNNFYTAGKIFLDDGNTAAANAYHLWGGRVGYKTPAQRVWVYHFYAGADNLLNETYSLGNDFNAAGGRYYNTAAKRNFYAGIAMQWNAATQKNAGKTKSF
ncbi:MAG: TonB-dependent receptor plug domain-containing protein [Bacteroidetes bacterium]|nr:TonB-dependent receptor plug domain-containing protein [Bacteroidota bacterium]